MLSPLVSARLLLYHCACAVRISRSSIIIPVAVVSSEEDSLLVLFSLFFQPNSFHCFWYWFLSVSKSSTESHAETCRSRKYAVVPFSALPHTSTMDVDEGPSNIYITALLAERPTNSFCNYNNNNNYHYSLCCQRPLPQQLHYCYYYSYCYCYYYNSRHLRQLIGVSSSSSSTATNKTSLIAAALAVATSITTIYIALFAVVDTFLFLLFLSAHQNIDSNNNSTNTETKTTSITNSTTNINSSRNTINNNNNTNITTTVVSTTNNRKYLTNNNNNNTQSTSLSLPVSSYFYSVCNKSTTTTDIDQGDIDNFVGINLSSSKRKRRSNRSDGAQQSLSSSSSQWLGSDCQWDCLDENSLFAKISFLSSYPLTSSFVDLIK